jgi:hypothetical protein
VAYSEDDFESDAQAIRADLYSAHGADGLRLGRFHLAIQILLSAFPLDAEDIQEQVLDDQRDQGIDYFEVLGGTENEICVVQVKDEAVFGREDQLAAVRKMAGEIHELGAKPRVGRSWPEKRKERYQDLKSVRGDEHRIRYILLLTSEARAASIHDEVNDLLRENETLEILDRSALAALETRNQAPGKPAVKLRLQREKYFEVEGAAGARTLVTHVNALDYVEATEREQVAIFRLNPRLYLGDKPSNRGMLETLRSDTERERFHLLNNGITVVCESYEINGDFIKTSDFQVVNGCQTTETLWKYKTEEPEKTIEVYVPLRIIETRNNDLLASRISETTNSQSAVASSDLVGNDPIQKEIKARLADGSPPIFYEARRGEARRLREKRVERNRFRVDPGDWGVTGAQGFRELGLKEFAQVLLAANTSPSNAKEQISSLFAKRGPDDLYTKLFRKSWSDPIQLQLLIETYLYICKEENWCPKGRTADASKELMNLSRVGRFYVLYLVYRQWRADKGMPHNPDENDPQLLSQADSLEIHNAFRHNIGDLPQLAVLALERTRTALKAETRPLLRQKSYRTKIEEQFDSLLALKSAIED